MGNVLTTISDNYFAQNSTAEVSARVLSSQDYFPFGMVMTERSFVESTEKKYRWGFNNQEVDNDLEEGAVVFKYRIEDVRIGKFWSVDPLAASYPWNSPYAFAENRVIDGIDLEGKEFSKKETIDNNGITQIKIVITVKPVNASNLMGNDAFNSLLLKTQEQFTKTFNVLDNKRNIQYSGEILYDNQATITMDLVDAPKIEGNAIAGFSAVGYTQVYANEYTKDGYIPNDIELMAIDCVHELIHQGIGSTHPNNKTNPAEDVALEKVNPKTLPKDDANRNLTYKTTATTIIPDIFYNIMLYGMFVVDGKKVSEVRGTEKNATKVSPDQLNVIRKNIEKRRVNGEPMADD
ncbi:MAG: hypothetical protein EAZ97_16515 [Bacteroidetes bacterium]|nr:MAG: hypothetical protein EAZ97_16515 [Bacteroidota bacterium]